jgi:hypothetical protein
MDLRWCSVAEAEAKDCGEMGPPRGPRERWTYVVVQRVKS